MSLVLRAVPRYALALICGLVIAGGAAAQRVGDTSKAVDNLMVVLREWKGGNKQDETLKPVGKVWTNFDGENITMELAGSAFSAT